MSRKTHNNCFGIQVEVTMIIYDAIVRLCGKDANTYRLTLSVIENYKPMSWYALEPWQIKRKLQYMIKRG